jgi:Sulfotransferase family
MVTANRGSGRRARRWVSSAPRALALPGVAGHHPAPRPEHVIVSHRHRFVFLKTRKTAGTSIELALAEICGPDDIVTPLAADDDALRAQHEALRGPSARRPQHYLRDSELPLRAARPDGLVPPRRDVDYYEHIRAPRARRYLGKALWQSYFKFTFERNPWDRLVSHYAFLRSRGTEGSFEDVVRTQLGRRAQNHLVYMKQGELLVDYVGRYETLEHSLAEALTRAGVSERVSLPRANSQTRGDRQSYTTFYDASLRDYVAELCAPEIERMGYVFGA